MKSLITLVAITLSFPAFAESDLQSGFSGVRTGCEESPIVQNSLDILESIQGTITCDPMDLVQDTGYRMKSNQLDILRKKMRTRLVSGLSDQQIQDQIERRIQRINPTPHRSHPEQMAILILDAANAFGLDPFIFAAMIEKESTYNINARSHTGAVGLGQFTNIGKKELTHQYGFVRGKFTNGVPEILKAQTERFFNADTHGYKSYMSWVQAPNERQLQSSFETSIVASAALLKVYLAVRDGNYHKALVQYNGSNIKESYAKEVRSRSQQIDFECAEIAEFEEQSVQTNAIACEIAGDVEACRKYSNELKIQDGQMWEI